MGAVLNAKRTGEASTPEVAKLALTMKTSDVKDFASTKHKKLPEKKDVKEGKFARFVRDHSKVKDRNTLSGLHLLCFHQREESLL